MGVEQFLSYFPGFPSSGFLNVEKSFIDASKSAWMLQACTGSVVERGSIEVIDVTTERLLFVW